MVPDDLEELINNAKHRHLSQETLVSYRDNLLDKMRVALADAHLMRCLICQEKLNFLKERAEIESLMTEGERAAIEESKRRLKAEREAPSFIATQIEKVKSYFPAMTEAWKLSFAAEATLGTEDGDEFWRYESEDGLLEAWGVRELDKSLTVHFSSSEPALQGRRIRFRLGPFNAEVTLHRQHEEDSEVVAEIKIPFEQRARNMADVSIEFVEDV
jgi:hypothetical protein